MEKPNYIARLDRIEADLTKVRDSHAHLNTAVLCLVLLCLAILGQTTCVLLTQPPPAPTPVQYRV